MAEPPKCPTSHCPAPRRHDKDRKITRYKCQTRGQEITQRTASAFKLTQYPAMCVQRGRHPEAPNRHIGCSVGSPASAFTGGWDRTLAVYTRPGCSTLTEPAAWPHG
jgi:hypothetical protein